MQRVWPASRARPIFTVCALFTGAALVAAVALHLSLAVTLASLGALACATFALVWRALADVARVEFRRRAIAGAAGGIAGVVAYDAVRFALVAGLHLHVKPFAALPLFGALISSASPGSQTSWIVGGAYHYLNGVMFGIAYGIALARRAWVWGIAWGVGLECFMLALYPGWLHVGAMLEEFTIMSSSGHLAYGAALGLTASSVVRRSRTGA